MSVVLWHPSFDVSGKPVRPGQPERLLVGEPGLDLREALDPHLTGAGAASLLGCYQSAVLARTGAVLERHGLPTRLAAEVTTADVLEAMARDKKADATALNMVMVAAPGDVRLRVNPPRERVVAAIEELRG
jgi:hypothetical protein